MQIYVSALSIKETSHEAGLLLNDLPSFVRQYEFEGLELSDRQLFSDQRIDLQRLKQTCSKADCGLIIDVNSDLTHSYSGLWRQEISHVTRMLRISHELGAKYLRICLGGQSLSIQKLLGKDRVGIPKNDGETTPRRPRQTVVKTLLLNRLALRFARVVRKNMTFRVRGLEVKMKRALSSLREIMPTVLQYKVPIAIENHWGISSRPENIMKLVEETDSPWLGTCPDFGNFPRDVNLYEGLRLLAPSAFHVHAKSVRFDKDGAEKDINYRRCLRILRKSGYDGNFTVEYEGRGNDLEGCLRTRELIIRYW